MIVLKSQYFICLINSLHIPTERKVTAAQVYAMCQQNHQAPATSEVIEKLRAAEAKATTFAELRTDVHNIIKPNHR